MNRPSKIKVVICLWFCLTASACSSIPFVKSNSGGYYGGDSAPANSDTEFDKIPDAIGNKTYTALGKTYVSLKTSAGYVKTGTASWYGKKFHGRRTSNSEKYDMWGMTAAHPILPLPSYIQVTNLETGKKIVVKVNDRGLFLHNRIIDLSYAAAHKLGIAKKGTGQVEVRAIQGANESTVDIAAINNSQFGTHSGVARTSDSSSDSLRQYFIQVGAYSDFDNAQVMRNELRGKGHLLHPQSDQKNLDLGKLYRVQVGPFSSVEQALQTKLGLEQILGQVLLLITK